MIFLRFATRRR